MARNTVSKPPVVGQQNLQYDLFTTFFGDAADLSNTIELWDAIPKYAVSPRTQNVLRSPNNRLPVHEYKFVIDGKTWRADPGNPDFAGEHANSVLQIGPRGK